ncbi:MAG: hypothetical protein OXG53_19785 [Chloroflexi bacterium]|nr:hypothetical protein [Chloroflexota bacterium]
MPESTAPSAAAQLEAESQSDGTPPAPRYRRARRLGCGLVLLFWFALLLTPCSLFYLAANGEIRLGHRDIPQPHAHPLLLVSLVSESEDRGLRIENSWIADSQGDGGMLCVETAVRFLLWQYSGGNQNVSFCDCYRRQNADANWEFVTTYGGFC